MKKMKLLLGVAAAVFMLAAPASAKAVEVLLYLLTAEKLFLHRQ